jgi:aryl-alcohol dehydrogenase-like predicted oxidoreductase
MAILHAAVDGGVTFFDTADVYGDGRSERFVGRLLKGRPGEKLFVATKTGRRAPEQIDQHYTESNLRSWVQRSLDNLGVESLDLVQWHCPPTETIQRDSMYELFDTLTSEGLIAGYGVSVETVVQALIAIDRPQVKSIQIIANAFRIKPFELVMPVAARAGVGIIVRVPLASGLLAAKYKADTVFGVPTRHRGGPRTWQGGTGGFDPGTGGAAVDHRPTGRDNCDSWGQWSRTGADECYCRGSRPDLGRVPGSCSANL